MSELQDLQPIKAYLNPIYSCRRYEMDWVNTKAKASKSPNYLSGVRNESHPLLSMNVIPWKLSGMSPSRIKVTSGWIRNGPSSFITEDVKVSMQIRK